MTTTWESLGSVAHRLDYREVDGVRTRVLDLGDGRPIVLLHGTGGHLEAYARNFESLAERFRVVAFDIAGHGFSAAPSTYRYDWQGLSGHVLAALAELEVENPVFVGEGLGAQLAQWIAIHSPQRLGGAILACTLIVPVEDADLLVQTPKMARFQELSRKALDEPTPELIRERMEWLMLDPASVTDELVALRLRTWMRDDVRDAQRRILASYLERPEDGGLHVTRDDVGRIETPLLVVWSRENPLMPAEVARRFVTYPASPCDYVEVDRSAMWPQFEEADRFNALVAGFVDSLPVTQGT